MSTDPPRHPAVQARLDALDQFIAAHGHATVPTTGEHRSLGSWIVTQRRNHRAHRLVPELRDALESRGVDLEPHERTRRTITRAFSQFAARCGHCDVPAGHVEVVDGREVALYAWLVSARNRHQQIEAHFRASLEAIGVDFTPRATHRERVLDALIAYAAQHGTYDVPAAHVVQIEGRPVDIGQWVRRHVPSGRSIARTLDLPPVPDTGDLTRDKKVRNAWRRRLARLDEHMITIGADAFRAGGTARADRSAAEVERWLDHQRLRLRAGELTVYEFRTLDLRGMRWPGRRPSERLPARYRRARHSTSDALLQDAYVRWRTPWIRSELIGRHERLARLLVAKALTGMPGHADRHHIESAAHLGLLEAIDRFDPAHGAAFTTYAVHRIRGSIIDAQRELDWLPRRKRAEFRAFDHAAQQVEQDLGRVPSRAELAAKLGIETIDLDRIEYERATAPVESLDFDVSSGDEDPFTRGDTIVANDLTAHVEAAFEARELAREIYRLVPDLDQWGDETWTSFLVALGRFEDEHGHRHVPLATGEVTVTEGRQVNLGNAVQWRRDAYQHGVHNPERDAYLEASGFLFATPEGTSFRKLRAAMETARVERQSRSVGRSSTTRGL